jgi:hypothetical protein
MRLSARMLLSVAALTLGVFTLNVSAATISQIYSGSFPGTVSGTLPNESSVLELVITLPNSGAFTASTTSYAKGGFQPNLTLFNSSGVTAATQSATPPPAGVADPTTGMILDGYLTASGLPAGMYTLTLTDWELGQSITATNLSQGFTSNVGNGIDFIDVTGATRTGAYTVDLAFTGSSPSAVPEPGTWVLTLLPMAAAIIFRRRRHSIQVSNGQ